MDKETVSCLTAFFNPNAKIIQKDSNDMAIHVSGFCSPMSPLKCVAAYLKAEPAMNMSRKNNTRTQNEYKELNKEGDISKTEKAPV